MNEERWSSDPQLRQINLHAAGIDIGSQSSWVAVPPGSHATPVREFGMFTSDLEAMSVYLHAAGVTTVVLESTGVYWIPVFEVLESSGLTVLLVDAHHVKQVSGRKTDVSDCQWLQTLHTFGLLRGAYRPADDLCALRSLVRQRTMLTQQRACHIQHMQKAMTQMNLQLHHVISEVTGVSGMQIMRAIVAGQRDPVALAQLRDGRIRASEATMVKALTGNYLSEHVFALKQALALYDFFGTQLDDCVAEILHQARRIAPPAANPPTTPPTADQSGAPKPKKRREDKDPVAIAFTRLAGVNLTTIDGISTITAITVLGEIGGNVDAWPSEHHFASWLRLAPNPRISGGKLLKRGDKRPLSRAALALRQGAQSLGHSTSALGAFYRRLKNRSGASRAITAAAHKMARIIYRMIKHGKNYVDQGQALYESKLRQRSLEALTKRAKTFGFQLVPT